MTPRIPGRILAAIFGLLASLSGSSIFAIVTSPASDITKVAPPDDPGWNNVGVLHNATGIYLGDGWVITAAHIGAGTITFPNLGTYTADPTTIFRPANPTGLGLTSLADLEMFRLTELPPLPPLTISPSTPPVASTVVVIGHGQDQAVDPSYWAVDRSGGSWVWNESTSPAEYTGYKTLPTNSMHWGTNLLEDEELVQHDFDSDIHFKLETSNGDTMSIVTEFDGIDSPSDDGVRSSDGAAASLFESQAVLNDSGGAMFYNRDGHWELAGITIAVEGHRNQPDVTRTPMYGNFSYYVDLAYYRSQIETKYLRGDLSGDHELDIADLDSLSGAIREGDFVGAYDFNQDQQLTIGDQDHWIREVFGTYVGDANLDRQFDTTDLVNVLQAGQYEDDLVGNSTWGTGDWNADGEFDTTDFVVALQDGGFEKGIRVVNSASDRDFVAAVPEPTGTWFVGSLLATLLMGVRRRVGRST